MARHGWVLPVLFGGFLAMNVACAALADWDTRPEATTLTDAAVAAALCDGWDLLFGFGDCTGPDGEALVDDWLLPD